ncbi:MAG: DUF956 family protein [Lactobacillaceae bacterium]|jgi:hypothetical protein|nr:DUF956 family protein [Lactobacillaceae bacterium]
MDKNINIDFQTRANAMMSPLNTKTGVISIGQPGMDFLGDNNISFLQFPWSSISYVSVDNFFGYWRGIYVVDNTGQQYQFVTSKTHKLIEAIAKHLKPEQIRQRKKNFSKDK